MKPGFALTALLVLLVSCVTQDICDENDQSALVARFKTGPPDNPVDTVVDGVTIYGIGQGQSYSLLYDSASVSRIVFPLDPAHDSTRFVIMVNKRADTLGISHDNDAYLISYNCGFAMRFHIRSIHHTSHLIRDVKPVNMEVDAELLQDETHIWIFF
jgi:hypothetical protein